MAENLNCDVSGSKCYDNDESNCATYGRLYDWATAMNLPSSCNSSTCASQVGAKHRGICPSGWHIPSNADWDKLMSYVDYVDSANGTSGPYYSPIAGRHLKAKEGWSDCGPSGSGKDYRCEDTHGFSALPGGYGYYGDFYYVGAYGTWWSSTEDGSYDAYYRNMSAGIECVFREIYDKDFLLSVRCVQD